MLQQITISTHSHNLFINFDRYIAIHNMLLPSFMSWSTDRIQNNGSDWSMWHIVHVSEAIAKYTMSSTLTILNRYFMMLSQKVSSLKKCTTQSHCDKNVCASINMKLFSARKRCELQDYLSWTNQNVNSYPIWLALH